MEASQIKAIVYLWSRDAGMDVALVDKAYLVRELSLIAANDRREYSDPDRARMAEEVAYEWATKSDAIASDPIDCAGFDPDAICKCGRRIEDHKRKV